MKKNYWLFAWTTATMMSGSILTSCTGENIPNEGLTDGGETTGYVISAAAGDANYLLKAASLDEGSVTAVGTGLETPTGTIWHFYQDKYLYRLQYNQGNAGVTTSYQLGSNGGIEERDYQYNITRFTTYATAGDYVMTISAVDTDKADDKGNKAKGLGLNYLHAEEERLMQTTIPGENFLGNGEYVTFAGVVEANNKVYVSVVPMGMSAYGVLADGGKWVVDPDKVATHDGGSYSNAYKAGTIPGTQFPDSAWVAIYDNEQFSGQTPTILRTGKIGYACGRVQSQYKQTICAADNGDVYVFSPGNGRTATGEYYTQGSLPSGVIRIKKGAKEFDPTYYVNIESLGDKQPMYRAWHITGDYFLLQMYTNGINGMAQEVGKLAIYKGEDKTLTYIQGLPEPAVIKSFADNPYCEKGVAYMPVVTTDGSSPALYRIDPLTATAKKGVTVVADAVSAVGKLTKQ
jgi:hypothetical protein